MRYERMTIEEYHLLPSDPAWKVEYLGGEAVWQARHQAVILTLPVIPREVKTPTQCEIRELRDGDQEGLAAAYVDAFTGVIDLCEYSPEVLAQKAAENVRTVFTADKAIQAACQVALDKGQVVGAALLARYENGPHLDVLFIRNGWRRHGLATALVSSALCVLHRQGETTLSSFHDIGNTISAAWHHAFGFVALPDLQIARLRWRAVQQNLERDKKLRELTIEQQNELKKRLETARAEVERLEEIQRREGFEAVHPLLCYQRRQQGK